MKKLLYLSLFILLVACSSSSHDIDEYQIGESVTEQPVIKPYSCDINSRGIEIVYKILGATKVSIMYKEQLAEDWTPLEAEITDSIITVKLTDLKLNHYYYVFATAQNGLGLSATDNFVVKYDYNSARDTYFTQPFLQWGAHVDGVKTALADKGSVLDTEVMTEEETRLTYRFMYKELWTEYVFDYEKHLKEVLVCFDKSRVNADELRKYINLAFGYLAYGNIHINIDGNEFVGTLFKTAEGASYTFIYEKTDVVIVDYMSTIGVDITQTLYK